MHSLSRHITPISRHISFISVSIHITPYHVHTTRVMPISWYITYITLYRLDNKAHSYHTTSRLYDSISHLHHATSYLYNISILALNIMTQLIIESPKHFFPVAIQGCGKERKEKGFLWRFRALGRKGKTFLVLIFFLPCGGSALPYPLAKKEIIRCFFQLFVNS